MIMLAEMAARTVHGLRLDVSRPSSPRAQNEINEARSAVQAVPRRACGRVRAALCAAGEARGDTMGLGVKPSL